MLAQQQPHAQWQALLKRWPRTGPGRAFCRAGAVAQAFPPLYLAMIKPAN
jgi:hypothetical protein